MTIVLKLFRKALQLFNRYCVNVCDVFCYCISQKQNDIQQTSVKVFVAAATKDLAVVHGAIDKEKQYKERFCRGEKLYYILDNGKIIGYGWKRDSVKSFYLWEIARDVRFEKPVSVLYDFFVEESHRRKGLYYSLLKNIISSADIDEYLVIYALQKNVASIRGIEKAGFKKWFEVSRLKDGR